jgi:hypothetical protein
VVLCAMKSPLLLRWQGREPPPGGSALSWDVHGRLYAPRRFAPDPVVRASVNRDQFGLIVSLDVWVMNTDRGSHNVYITLDDGRPTLRLRNSRKRRVQLDNAAWGPGFPLSDRQALIQARGFVLTRRG